MAKEIGFIVGLSMVFLFGLIWFGIILYLRLKKRKTLVYLLFFTLFFIYLYKVFDYTLFQFQSLILLKHFVPNLMLNGIAAGKSVNLIPFSTLTRGDLKTSLLNILLMIPFGFGLPFITSLRMKQVVVSGALVSLTIELLQLVTGLVANTTFRVADSNDVIFNTVGVAIGYIIFVGLIRFYRWVSRDWTTKTHPILRYVAERPQVK